MADEVCLQMHLLNLVVRYAGNGPKPMLNWPFR